MDHVAPVRLGESFGALDQGVEQVLPTGTEVGKGFLERTSLEEFEDQEKLAAFFLNRVDGTDVGMADSADRLRLTNEAAAGFLVLDMAGMDQLESDFPVQA